MTMFGEPIQLVDVVWKYALGVTLTVKLTHLEGERYLVPVNRSSTCFLDQKGIPIGHVNFSHPCVNT
jgi:hypothetical protein